MPRKRDTRDRNERVEDILHPAPYLGYDRDTLARHLMACGAFRIAESQFRRAVWLNPFEAKFKQHLALCLHAEKQYAEARDWITKSLEQEPDNAQSQRIFRMIEEALRRVGARHAVPLRDEEDAYVRGHPPRRQEPRTRPVETGRPRMTPPNAGSDHEA